MDTTQEQLPSFPMKNEYFRKKNTSRLLLISSLTAIILLGAITFLLYINRQLNERISTLKDAAIQKKLSEYTLDQAGMDELSQSAGNDVTQAKPTGSAEPIMQTNSLFPKGSKEVASEYTFTKKVDYAFRYPEQLIMQPDMRRSSGSYAFYASDEDYQKHKECIERQNREEDWEGACDFNNLLFILLVSESNNPISEPFSAGTKETYLRNANQITFKTHREMLGGMAERGGYSAITIRYRPDVRDWGMLVVMDWPSEAARTRTEEATGMDNFDLFTAVLNSFKIEATTSR